MSLFSDAPGLKRVPDFTGLDFDAVRALETASGRGVRHPDPDAPPISGYWSVHRNLGVASQAPAPGALLPRDERVAVTLAEPTHEATPLVRPEGPPLRQPRFADEECQESASPQT